MMDTFSFNKSSKYGFSIGRIKALESKLIDRNMFERLLDAPSVEIFMDELDETYLKDYIINMKQDEDFDSILEKVQKALYDELLYLSQDQELKFSLLFPLDINNIKIILKSSLTGSKDNQYLVNYGNFPIQLVQKIVEHPSDPDRDRLPDFIVETIEDVKSEYTHSSDAQIVDLFFDRLLFQNLLNLGYKLSSEFIVRISRMSIDLFNALILLRLKFQVGDLTALKNSVLPHGLIVKEKLFSLYENEGIDGILSFYLQTPYSRIFKFKYDSVSDLLARLEKRINQFIIDFFKSTDYLTSGYEPVLAYLYRKREEFRKLRTIYYFKKNGFTPERIRSFL